jgi:N-acetylneuraminate synthase
MSLSLAKNQVGSLAEKKVYIIAEAGVNHDGSVDKARRLIDIASEAKADAVKFQLFRPDELASPDAPLASYQERSGEESQHAMLQRLTLPLEEYGALKTYAEKKDLDFITTPFDAESATFLAGIGVQAIKIPSGELTNLPFLRQVAELSVFTIISTGMSSLEEIRDAVGPFEQHRTPYALLHCVSAYPAPMDQINLRAMDTMRSVFQVPIGYSDHTLGIEVSLAAAALGASIIEKHFTINRNDPGPDHAASLEPGELHALVQGIRTIGQALGSEKKECQFCEINTRDVARRSLILTRSVKAGEPLTADMIAIRRPGTGLPPKDVDRVIGKKVARDLDAGSLLSSDVLA